jgi:hypothetical protein
LPGLSQNNDAYLLNCKDEVWNQSSVKGKLKFEILHVRNNAKMHYQEDGSSSKASITLGDGTSPKHGTCLMDAKMKK